MLPDKYNDWSFPVPPVCTALWTSDDWVRWVERHGTKKKEVKVLPWSDTHQWRASGDRDENGQMLYRLEEKKQ